MPLSLYLYVEISDCYFSTIPRALTHNAGACANVRL